MLTVFPTPAPPNNPTFPPLANGQTKSITLMPVSRISFESARSTYSGGFLCIGILSFVFTSPFISIGSPNTFIILPRVASPTGTLIGALVFSTSSPLFNPSVVPMATVLTTPSPNCCCVSRTRLFSLTTKAS